MSDILRQVDEDLRKDRLLDIWRRYRVYIISSILIILISLSGYQYFIYKAKLQNEIIVEEYIDAINSTDKEIALNKLNNLDSADNTLIRGFSKLKRADLLMSLEKKDLSNDLLKEIFIDESLDSIIRDLALYKYLMAKLDTLDQDIFFDLIDEDRLNESEFKYLFVELKALKLLIEGDKNSSFEIFESIVSNNDFPVSIKTRAKKFKKISK